MKCPKALWGNQGQTFRKRTNKISKDYPKLTQNEYQSKGYYLAVEVKGDTGQHWVAVLSVNGNNINMADPGSDGNVMWNTYNWNNTSQFVYFKVKGQH